MLRRLKSQVSRYIFIVVVGVDSRLLPQCAIGSFKQPVGNFLNSAQKARLTELTAISGPKPHPQRRPKFLPCGVKNIWKIRGTDGYMRSLQIRRNKGPNLAFLTLSEIANVTNLDIRTLGGDLLDFALLDR